MTENEYSVGQRITLTRGVKYGENYDRSFLGSVLEVVAVDLPFLVVRELVAKEGHPSLFPGRAFALKLDDVEVKHLSEPYVEAMLASSMMEPLP